MGLWPQRVVARMHAHRHTPRTLMHPKNEFDPTADPRCNGRRCAEAYAADRKCAVVHLCFPRISKLFAIAAHVHHQKMALWSSCCEGIGVWESASFLWPMARIRLCPSTATKENGQTRQHNAKALMVRTVCFGCFVATVVSISVIPHPTRSEACYMMLHQNVMIPLPVRVLSLEVFTGPRMLTGAVSVGKGLVVVGLRNSHSGCPYPTPPAPPPPPN